MTVQASLIDFRQPAGGAVPELRRDIKEIAAPGKLVFLMEMRDSESDRVLARAADSDNPDIPAFVTSADMETDWSRVEAAAERWAALFRNFLDANLGGR